MAAAARVTDEDPDDVADLSIPRKAFTEDGKPTEEFKDAAECLLP